MSDIYDRIDDVPEYGGPVIGLPPDLDRSKADVLILNRPRLWHWLAETAERVGKIATGNGIRVAVLDTGYTKHVDGPDPVAARSFISGQPIRDLNGHGSHCIGSAIGRNGIGIAPAADLIVGKVLSDQGSGGSDGIAAGIRWAADQGADVINLSLGGGGSYAPTNQAIDYAMSKGCIVNAAAGNSGFSGSGNTIGWPARHPGALCCGAYRADGQIANFSSGGREMDWACPGQDIVSFSNTGSGYRSMSGTCVAEGNYVYTPDGPSKIEDIQAGDEVFAYADGQRVVRVVSHTWQRGTNNVIQLSAAGRDVEVTETHQMLTYDKLQNDLEWVPAKDLDPQRHFLVVPKALPTRANPYLDTVVGSEFAYILGYMLGDGRISSTARGKRVGVAEDEKEHVMQHVTQLYKQLSGKDLTSAKNGRWFYDDSTRIALLLECAGLRGYAWEKTIPFWVWHLSQSKQDSLLKGYFAADAHRKRNAKTSYSDSYSLETVSGDLARRIACLWDYRGLQHGVVRSRQRGNIAPHATQSAWRPTYALNATCSPLADGWSAVERTNEKRGLQKMRDMGLSPEDFTLARVSIKDKGKTVRVYDLTVPGADNFVTQGLVTHNSMATPVGSGFLALLIEIQRREGNPRWTAIEAVRTFLRANLRDAGAPGWDPRFGHGIPVADMFVTAMMNKDLKWA